MEKKQASTTAAQLIEFLNKSGQRGDINPTTASIWASTARTILSIESNWEGLDLSQMDIDEFVNRFKNLKRLDYKDGSIDEYEKRFRRVVKMFLEYANDPSAWKTPVRSALIRKADSSRADKTPSRTDAEPLSSKGGLISSLSEPPATLSASDFSMIDYPFPLRDKCIARLRLPVDLKMAEVERLVAFMRSIAIDSISSYQ